MTGSRGKTLERVRSLPVVEGLIVRTESGFHRVRVDGGILIARAPKRLLAGERVTTTAIVIGDRVRVRPLRDGSALIEEVLERDNELVRGAAGGSRFLDVIAANLDQLVAVHSLKDPDLVPARLDRLVLIAEAAEIPATVCLNKTDLATSEEVAEASRVYCRAGYPVLTTSTVTGEGIDGLRAALGSKISALVGPSGVGKSSLLNAIQPGLRLRTGAISETTGKGRHTTTTAELLPLSEGGWVADTPGLRELALREVEPEDLAWLFPEMRDLMTHCRFSDCSHRGEMGCAVRGAVESGAIPAGRYGSYLRVYEDLLEQRPY